MRGPYYWLDLRDANDHPDSQKVLPTLLFFAALLFHALGRPLSWATLVILGAIAFGFRMFGLFLRRSSFRFGAELRDTSTRSESRTEHVTEVVQRRADPDALASGSEDTP